MKLFAPVVYLYYFLKGIVTSPLYAWRRTMSFYKNPKPKVEKSYPGPKFVGASFDGHFDPTKPHKRRKHRGGRKHRKFHKPYK